ncbi:MAG: acyl carrier protein [Dorea sp.]|nr:acyl carrier protein [Dorea sp.]
MKEDINLKESILGLINDVGVDIDENEEIRIEMDSLQFVALICDLEGTFDIVFSDEELLPEKYQNINEFITYVENKIISQKMILTQETN